MRFIAGSICVLLGLFVVGGARPMERGTGAGSTSSAGPQSRVPSEQENPVHILTMFSTFKVHNGVLKGISTGNVDEMTGEPEVCMGLPWVKIILTPGASWPDSAKQLSRPSSPYLSATPYVQSSILLLLQQSGVLSSAIIKEGCVHFTSNLHYVEASIPKDGGIGAQVSIYSSKDRCLSVSHVYIFSASRQPCPFGMLTASKLFNAYEGELTLTPAGVTGVIKQCGEFLTSVFSEAHQEHNELPTQGQLPSQGHHA
ncbi:hypothetical protein FB446DRAFT_730721 [Lentinula raphanica]|nr:hypothetical protein C8R42DRAFT_36695 [Lentinula raphanica]KAJ3773990.1 hypothetical protein FB446DRAFT_730721 [Lentinula raphanica]